MTHTTASPRPGLPAGSPTLPTPPVQSPLQSAVQIPTQTVDALATAVFAYATALRDVGQDTLKKFAVFRNTTLSTREKALLKFGTYVQNGYALHAALQQDLMDQQHGRYTFLRSHTLEAVGHFGLDTFAFLKLDQVKSFSPFTRGALQSVDGAKELVEAVSKIMGQRKMDLDSTSHLIKAIEAFAAVPFAAEQSRLKTRAPGLAKQLPWLDVVADGLAAIHAHQERSNWRHVDVLTRYADTYIKAFWTGVGVSACKSEYTCVQAIQSFGTAASKFMREITRAPLTDLTLWASGNRKKVMHQWYATQQRNISLGLPVTPISTTHTVPLLKQNGFRDADIRKVDQAVMAYNAHLASHTSVTTGTPPVSAGSQQHHDQDVSGVKLGAEPTVEAADLQSLKDAVLRHRRPNSLSFELP